MLEPVKKLVIVGIFDESIRGVEHKTRRLKLCSRYSFIPFHVMVRLASQATGLAFAVGGYTDVSDLLVACFILGGESFYLSF